MKLLTSLPKAKAYDYLIVGAGLFGATFAAEATARGKRCLVIDRRDHIGGNVYTEERDGVRVHVYGAHIFHTSDERVWAYINRYAKFNSFINAPVARYRDRLYNLPFNMNTFHGLWPDVFTPAEARARIAEQSAACHTDEPRNLEEHALSMVGRDVYEALIKGYTEKQWGRPCTELPPSIIKRLPLRFTYDNNYFNDRYQGIPIGGYTPIVERMLDGADVLLSTDFIRHRDALCAVADKTVFCGMIDEYFGFSLGHLEYRTVSFETETLPTDNYQGCAVVNYTEAEIPYTRIIEHKHFESTVSDKTVISREYPTEWTPALEPYYPVNNERNTALYEAYRALADREENVIFGGRLGEYRYYDMDKVIAAALRVCDTEFDA